MDEPLTPNDALSPDASPQPPTADTKDAAAVQTPAPHPPARETADDAQPETARPARGTVLNGRIAQVQDKLVLVNVGPSRTAALSTGQFDADNPPRIDAELDIVVSHFDAKHDWIRAHRKGTVEAELDMLQPGAVLEAKVTGMIKGGLELQAGVTRCFMPASQVDTNQRMDISILLGETVRAEVLEADRKHKKLVVSRRKLLKREQEDAATALLAQLKPGDIRTGVVTNLAEFGAFVDLGGIHGLVHISDMRWSPVEKPGDVVKIGDEIKVKVLKVNRERNRISLGLKQAAPNPWSTVRAKFSVGDKIKTRVVTLTEFGAFARIADGVNGLIPLGEMSWTRRPAKPDEVLQVDQELEAAIIEIDSKRRRITLSLRRTTEDPWSGIETAFPVNQVAKGTVCKLLDFGALVQLREGVEGMIHISELSTGRVKTPGDVVNVGDEVEVKVLNIDKRKRRVALSIKALTQPAADASAAVETPHTPKLRKKPLRGGLASHFEW